MLKLKLPVIGAGNFQFYINENYLISLNNYRILPMLFKKSVKV